MFSKFVFLIVDQDGSIKTLDSIYYPQKVQNYLFQNIKLDSPSSTRYKMLELYKENN
ncbi:MAG: HpaII family restriction endonuclease [Brevinema sp.]